VYDLSQNASGIMQISVSGKRGRHYSIYPAELLKPDSSAVSVHQGSPYIFNTSSRVEEQRSRALLIMVSGICRSMVRGQQAIRIKVPRQ
jgi:hypothetical protein